nr:hypothetical protein Hi04_10k_c5801_00010 [uncultured bacterium]
MKRWLLLLVWAGVLTLWGMWLGQQLKVASDLSLFLPKAQSDLERVLVTELRGGPTSRLVLLAISNDDPIKLAKISHSMAERLRSDPLFTRIENGEQHDDPALRELVMRYRYLLSPAIDEQRFSVAGLHSALLDRVNDLASPADPFITPMLPHDPTGELLTILSAWTPADSPQSFHGVWFSPDHQRALLLAETRAPGFDLDAQTTALHHLEKNFSHLSKGEPAKFMAVGPGPFGVSIQKQAKHDAQLFGTLDSLVLLGFLLLAYRSPRLVILAGLPLTTGGLAAMTVAMYVYGGIHGITLAFGSTLMGVALDYPVHVFSHRLPGGSAWKGLDHNWPTLWISVLMACIAYIALVFTDFPALAQLGVFTVAGLVTAAATTRWLLPPLLPDRLLDIHTSWAGVLQARLDRLPPLPWLAPVLIVISLASLFLSPHALWENDLSTLSPVPTDLQDADSQLRRDLRTADVRYIALVFGDSADQALARSEVLSKQLDDLVKQGAISGYDLAAQYLPSSATQLQRRAALPESAVLKTNLDKALEGLPFRSGLFAPFLQDVEATRSLSPLTQTGLGETLLGTRVGSLLTRDDDGWFALLPLHGLKDPKPVREWFDGHQFDGARFLDLKGESERLVAGFRLQMLERVGAGVLVMVVLMVIGLNARQAIQLVILPSAATVLSMVATYNLLGIQLSVFHLVALMLVVGISIDYGLYLSRDEADMLARARSLHALLICCVSTAIGFGILAMSQIPVLRAIGVTASVGVVLGLVLGALGARASLEEDIKKAAH